MKRFYVLLFFSTIIMFGYSQQNMITVSGGYSWCNVDASDVFSQDPNVKGTGWRINGLYEFNPLENKLAYGLSIGYISVTAEYDGAADSIAEFKVSTLPIYFAPKYMMGNEKVKGFIKGALGVQSARLERTGSYGSAEGKDFGLYLGAGAGLMFFISEKVFINAEYEIAYMTNAYYRNGMMQSAMGGIGFKF